MTRQHVLVLHNELILPEDHPDYVSEIELMDNVEAVSDVLAKEGYRVTTLGVPNDPQKLIDCIRDHQPDVVFNLYEGSATNNATELYAAGIMEWLGVPYTGCPFHTLVLARSKHLAKRLFLAEGLPTAPFLVVDEGHLTKCPLQFPVIVKPSAQDASLGVEQASVVRDLEALNRRIDYVLEQFGGPVMVEEFIHGRELTVALVEVPELRLLPGTEVIFPSDPGPDYWPILSYDAKWTKGSPEFETTDYHFKAELTSELAEKIDRYSRQAYRLLGCRDYARVDFRIREDEPYILEVNPNPDFAPDRGMSNNLWAGGLTHEGFTVQLVRNALRRGRGIPPARYRERQAG